MSSAKPLCARSLTRRELLAVGVSGAIAFGLLAAWPDIAEAAPKDAKRKIAEIAGEAALDKDGITLTMPARTDRATFVPVSVRVDSPMTEEHHVTAIHLLTERNTKPDVTTYHLTPLSGRAEISTRIRIAKSGVVVALAQLSDGSVRIAKARVKVAAGARGCG